MKIVLLVLVLALFNLSCSDRGLIPLKVQLGTRSISKLPFVIALDQGLYEKYGLDVDLRMPSPDFEDGKRTHSGGLLSQVWRRTWIKIGVSEPWRADILVDGLTPNIVKLTDQARHPHRVAVAATDCVVRAHIVGSTGLESLDQLKGKRLGISARRDTTTGFVALMLASRMGWDADRDISIKLNGRDLDALRDGMVDAIVASEIRYAIARQEGFPILEDTRTWNEPIAGNSVMVTANWLQDEGHHEAVRRFLRATIEGIALFHRDRELALDVLARWHGITDREVAETAYDRGRWIPRKPYPCYDGIQSTMELYDSNEMRRFSPDDFYDDSFLKGIDQSGFIDSQYDQKE